MPFHLVYAIVAFCFFPDRSLRESLFSLGRLWAGRACVITKHARAMEGLARRRIGLLG